MAKRPAPPPVADPVFDPTAPWETWPQPDHPKCSGCVFYDGDATCRLGRLRLVQESLKAPVVLVDCSLFVPRDLPADPDDPTTTASGDPPSPDSPPTAPPE